MAMEVSKTMLGEFVLLKKVTFFSSREIAASLLWENFYLNFVK